MNIPFALKRVFSGSPLQLSRVKDTYEGTHRVPSHPSHPGCIHIQVLKQSPETISRAAPGCPECWPFPTRLAVPKCIDVNLPSDLD